jgi:hypothetical protein
MSYFLVLWLLATVDSALTGYRAAAGLSALIDKRAYYRRAMLRGALYGQAAVLTVGAAFALGYLLTADRALLWRDVTTAAARMLSVYLPYSFVLGAAFLIRLLPSTDLRSITSVAVFGPFTLIRPLVAAAGVLWGIAGAPRPVVILLGLLALALMLSLERVLSRPGRAAEHRADFGNLPA